MEWAAIIVTIAIALVGAITSGIIWNVRLEGRVNAIESANEETQKDVDALRAEHTALTSKILDQLSDLKAAIFEIKGYFRASKDNNREE